jgi:uncharacterized protein YggE
MPPQAQPPSKNKTNISADSRVVCLLLLLIIAGMLFLWKPWSGQSKNTNRTVQVTGSATIKAVPDEFVFSPSYEFTNANKQSALDELTKKSDEIVAQLKKMGVADSAIKSNSDGYQRGIYFPEVEPGVKTATYTLSLTVTVNSKDLAQKVQDYLVTTSPSGAVSPTTDFSEAKQKQLQSQARDQAEKDARSKAAQSAKNLGFKLGSVKTISEEDGFKGIMPMFMNGAQAASDSAGSTSRLAVQPGQNDLNYQVSVTYFIK